MCEYLIVLNIRYVTEMLSKLHLNLPTIMEHKSAATLAEESCVIYT